MFDKTSRVSCTSLSPSPPSLSPRPRPSLPAVANVAMCVSGAVALVFADLNGGDKEIRRGAERGRSGSILSESMTFTLHIIYRTAFHLAVKPCPEQRIDTSIMSKFALII